MEQSQPLASSYPSPISDQWLQDKETGFLYCAKPSQTGQDFSIEKKKMLLDTYRGTFPDLTEALSQAGVSRRTVYWHLKFDTAFRDAFQEIREERADKTESRLYKDSLTPKQFMAQIAILRAYRPGLYTEKRINLTSRDLDPGTLERKAGFIGAVIDTQLIEASTQVLAPGHQDPRPVTISPEVSKTNQISEQKETPKPVS